jgi:RNA-splicing ligase RtcB
MNYKQAYEETFEQLYLLKAQMTFDEQKEAKTLHIVGKLGNVITTLHNSAEKSSGERKEKAEKILTDLVSVHQHIGQIYLSEMATKARNLELNKNILDLATRLESAEKRVKELEEMDKF